MLINYPKVTYKTKLFKPEMFMIIPVLRIFGAVK